jgi:hypothetical protein
LNHGFFLCSRLSPAQRRGRQSSMRSNHHSRAHRSWQNESNLLGTI